MESSKPLTAERNIAKGSKYFWHIKYQLMEKIVLGLNNTSIFVGHFVSFPGKREKRDRRDSRGDERDGQGRKRNRNESEETEEIKNIPPLPLPATRIAGLAQL